MNDAIGMFTLGGLEPELIRTDFSLNQSTIELGDSLYFTHIRSSAIGAFWG